MSSSMPTVTSQVEELSTKIGEYVAQLQQEIDKLKKENQELKDRLRWASQQLERTHCTPEPLDF